MRYAPAPVPTAVLAYVLKSPSMAFVHAFVDEYCIESEHVVIGLMATFVPAQAAWPLAAPNVPDGHGMHMAFAAEVIPKALKYPAEHGWPVQVAFEAEVCPPGPHIPGKHGVPMHAAALALDCPRGAYVPPGQTEPNEQFAAMAEVEPAGPHVPAAQGVPTQEDCAIEEEYVPDGQGAQAADAALPCPARAKRPRAHTVPEQLADDADDWPTGPQVPGRHALPLHEVRPVEVVYVPDAHGLQMDEFAEVAPVLPMLPAGQRLPPVQAAAPDELWPPSP